jgi:hypothetical protein
MNVHFKNINPVLSSVLKKRPVRILVFKTNLRYKKDIRHIEPLLDRHPDIMCWNVDRYDIDNILRIETMHVQPYEIIRLVTKAGYFCEELPD